MLTSDVLCDGDEYPLGQLASIMSQEVLGKQIFESLLQTLPSADLDQNGKLIMNRQNTNQFLYSVLFNGMLHLRLIK